MKIEDVKQWQCVNGLAVAVNPYEDMYHKSSFAVAKYLECKKWASDPANQPVTDLSGIYNSEQVKEVWAYRGVLSDDWAQDRPTVYAMFPSFDAYSIYAKSLCAECETRRRLVIAEPKVSNKTNGITPEHKSFARIDFKNCGLDYDYTICEWCDLKPQLDVAECAILDAEPSNYAEYGEPEIKITPCFMTEYEFDIWFKECMENNA